MCIAVICCPVCDVINFEIDLRFLFTMPFFYITKNRGQNVNTSRTKRTSNIKQKALFIIVKEHLVVRNCLRPEIRSLKQIEKVKDLRLCQNQSLADF